MAFSQTLQIVENDFLILYENLIPVQRGSFLVEAWQEGGNEQHSTDSWGLSPHTLKLRLSPKDDGSSEGDQPVKMCGLLRQASLLKASRPLKA